MKHTIKFGLMGGMILFCLSMSLTSCEDILGEWSKPVPNTVTPGGGDGGGGSDGGGSSTINATSLALDAILRLDKTTPKALTPTVTPSDAAITWESSDETIATVDATGKVTPIKVGKVTIKATSGDLSATSNVIVYDKIHNINTDGDASVSAGEWLIEGNGTAVGNSITIADGASVVLNGINITKQIVCSGTANIILADGSTNTVTVSTANKAGIKIGGTGKTLTINAETAGTGKLTATGGVQAAGIGTDCIGSGTLSCGNIVINGGTVTATGGQYGAGIGTGQAGVSFSSGSITCGDITINGGTVTAQGGEGAAGIGTGRAGVGYSSCSITCGDITIGTGVISVTAKKSSSNPGPNSIGKGALLGSSTQNCDKITIGGVEYWDGAAYQNGGNTYLTGDIIYTPAP